MEGKTGGIEIRFADDVVYYLVHPVYLYCSFYDTRGGTPR
jgi:hypothetical protein